MEIILKRTIFKSEEKKHIYLPFGVPENIELLEVEYSYDKKLGVIDIAILDEFITRGSSGSNKDRFVIHENYATESYVHGIIEQGTWKICLGAYILKAEQIDVEIKINMTEKRPVLLIGDLHAHTIHSDGAYTPEYVVETARLNGLDFIFLTDHNAYTQNYIDRTTKDFVVLPGTELTQYEGHCNLLGVDKPVKNFIADTKEEMSALMSEAQSNGAFVSINHPFCPQFEWNYGYDMPFDAIEIWNGPIRECEYRSIYSWHSFLCQGKIIPAVGGSDAHKNEFFRIFGTPATSVYAKSTGKSDILNALRKGNSFISHCPDNIKVELKINDSIMGDTVEFSEGQICIVTAADCEKGDIIKIISNTGTEQFVIDSKTFIHSFDVENVLFYRVEVYRELIKGLTILATITNPIYIR